MVTRGSHVMVASLLVFAVLLVGCAKRPATTQASAPAPTPGAAGAGPAGAGPVGAGPAGAGPVGAGPAGVGRAAMPGTQPGAAARAGVGAPSPAVQQPGGAATAAARTPSAVTRPSPKEFEAHPALKDIHFDFDKYDIRPGDAKILDANAQWLKSNPTHLVLIEGHCDERGTNEYNLALGERRAKATMNYLVSQGVQANRITIISYGEERPVCTEKNEQCWSRNRRAHFLVKLR